LRERRAWNSRGGLQVYERQVMHGAAAMAAAW